MVYITAQIHKPGIHSESLIQLFGLGFQNNENNTKSKSGS